MNETWGPCLQLLSGRAAFLIRWQHSHRWDIVLGMDKTAREVAALKRGMTAESWTAKKYHPFSKSCNYFCEASSIRMRVRKVPFSANRGLVFSTWFSPRVLCMLGCVSSTAKRNRAVASVTPAFALVRVDFCEKMAEMVIAAVPLPLKEGEPKGYVRAHHVGGIRELLRYISMAEFPKRRSTSTGGKH